MTSSSGRSNEDFEREWREIAEDLKDIEEPTEPIAPPAPSRATHSGSRPGAAGPRDWSPADEGEVEDILAEEDDASYRDVSVSDLKVAHPARTIAWLVSVALIVLGIAVGIGLIPGPGLLSGALVLAGFVAAAAAAFLSARKDEDPFDDGARI